MEGNSKNEKMRHKEYHSIHVLVIRTLYICALSPFAFQEYHLYVLHGYKRLNSQLFCYVEQKSLQHSPTLQKKKYISNCNGGVVVAVMVVVVSVVMATIVGVVVGEGSHC